MTDPVVLLVEDDPAHAELALRTLEASSSKLELTVVETLGAARAWTQTHLADLIVADLRLPDGSAIELLAHEIPLVIMTSQGDEQHAVAAMKGGALDYVVKSPEMYRDLPITISRALRAARSEREKQRAEASLRESEERFRQLADNIQEAFWLYDIRDSRMVYVSPAWTRVYGQEASRVLANPEARFANIHVEDRAGVRALFEQKVPPRTTAHEFRVVVEGTHTSTLRSRAEEPRASTPSTSSTSSTRWVEERTQTIDGFDGEPWRIAGIGTDVTRRHELEAALRQSQKMEAVGQLAGGVAHDFNNMLTVILHAAEELGTLATTDDQRRLSELVISAAERTADLTRKLLAFSRKGKVRSTRVDVHTVVADVVLLLGRSIDPRIKVVTRLAAPSAVVLGDPGELQNALLNLGLNARDAMPDGGLLEISSTLRELDAADCATIPFALTAGPFLQLSVRDAGSGIAVQHLARVFEPFFTTKPVGKGTGLGLSAVYGTVVEHHGAITVYSEVGHGTVFHLYLPLSAGPLPKPISHVEPPLGSGLVLLVDDEPLVRNMGERLLLSLGYEVALANDGEQAVRLFAEHHTRLVAVLCDVIMPERSGSDAIDEMNAIDASVPIIVCSGFPRDEQLSRTGQPLPFLAKPYHRSELATILAHVARRPDAAR